MTTQDESMKEQEYWNLISLEAPIIAIAKCEEAAKQLITLTSLTITIYIGIISFGDILKQPLAVRPALLFLLLPLPFWLISLILATRVIIPQVYAIKKFQEDYLKISRVKYSFLRWSYSLLIISMIALIAVIAIYLLFVPPLPV